MGQGGALRFTKVDTSCHYGKKTSAFFDSFYYDLPDVSKSTFKTHIRLRLNGQIVDLFSEDNKTFNGFLTYYVYQSLSNRNKKKKSKSTGDKIIVQKILLNSDTCTQVAHKILNSGQLQIPSLRQDALDCATIKFSFKINSLYCEQDFDCMNFPQNSIKEKAIVDSNLKLIRRKFNLQSPYNSLIHQIPYEDVYTYSDGGMDVITLDFSGRNYNRRQARIFRKRKANGKYLDSVQSYVNEFLETELARILNKEYWQECCNDDYILHFSKRNRLFKIITDKSSFEKGDTRNFRHRKRKLRKAFRRIGSGFIHSKFKYIKELNFDEGIPIIRNHYY